MWHSAISFVTVILSMSSLSSIWEKVSAITDFISSLICTPHFNKLQNHNIVDVMQNIVLFYYTFFPETSAKFTKNYS